ncbi:helix-turn-helix transcriptional regulator [Furfurilactobacillus milii]|uniref:helix-turn-helix transcriptional regulator n=1 Tax=Furfurilactobacillus milii TaxID=2888272 RepID=UPI001F47C4C7|nr:helix-turn-helix transcriptional regulator [Furfurilactobacillus milii]MCF6419734.1 helix-turn-helix transcriptional regulator [Furfurilactobacillus milii]
MIVEVITIASKQNPGLTITNKVYEYRVLNHLSQIALAKAVGVSKQTILVMEKGNYSPTLKLAFEIAIFFKVDITDIFGYKEN